MLQPGFKKSAALESVIGWQYEELRSFVYFPQAWHAACAITRYWSESVSKEFPPLD